MKKHLFVLALLFLTNAFAQNCEEQVSLAWILEEAEDSDPRILLERLRIENIEAQKKVAGKIINPELEHFSVWGKEFEPGKVYMNESRLWFTLQLASKRQKKLSEWAKSKDLAIQEQEILKQSLLKDLWLNFFRIHQINEEISLKKSLIKELETILNKYKKRKFLSPDQSLEENIFTMVVNNFELSLSRLERDKLSILTFFKEITAFKCNIQKIKSEGDKIRWPKSEDLQELKSLTSMNLKLAELTLEQSKAELSLANSQIWPDLKLSPVVQNYKSTEKNNYMYGVAFTMPLPFFDRNQGLREQSLLKQKYSEKKIQLTQIKEETIFDYKIKKYTDGLKILSGIDVIDQSLGKFQQVMQVYQDGKLSISNIVEYCRQVDEMMNNYHEGEGVLMIDLMEIYEQRGQITVEIFNKLI